MMISNTKTTQILEVLYPDVIPTSEFDFVATVILPDIKKLVDMVGTPSIQDVHVPESKYSIQCTPAPLTEKIETKRSTYDIKDGELIGIDNKNYANVVTCSGPIFIEHSKHIIDDTWDSTEYGDVPFLRKDDNRVIRGVSSRVDTTWEYLCKFFDSLPEQTIVNSISGVNKKKLRALIKLYEVHPNFSCHVEIVKKHHTLVKDEVRVDNDTLSGDDVGTVDPEHYGE